MTNEIGLRIRAARKRAGLTQDELARKLSVSRPAIAQWESGKTAPNTKKLNEVSRALGLPRLDLFHAGSPGQGDSEGDSALVTVRTVPELSWSDLVSLQGFELMEEAGKQGRRWPCPVPCSDKAFALKVESEAMSPRFPPGTLIVVDPEVEPTTGCKVVALTDEAKATFREYSREGSEVMLKAINPAWPSPFTRMDANDEIIGTVIFAGFEV